VIAVIADIAVIGKANSPLINTEMLIRKKLKAKG